MLNMEESLAIKSSSSISKYHLKIQIGIYNITYVKVGNGPQPIFVFPGLLGSMEAQMIPVIDIFANIGQRYTLYTWDQPGYHNSQPLSRRMEDITFLEESRLCAEFLKALGHNKYDILGYSAGAQTALLFVSTYPEMVNKVAVWSPFDLIDEESHASKIKYLKQVQAENPGLSSKETGMDEHHALAWINSARAEFNISDSEAWQLIYDKLDFPILIVHGGRDALVQTKSVESLHKRIKNSRLIIMKKAPHRIQDVYVDYLFQILNNFLMGKEEICINVNGIMEVRSETENRTYLSANA